MNEAEILQLSEAELEAEIRRHDTLYWSSAAPEISDELYDAMVERLRRINPHSLLPASLGRLST